MSPTSSAVWPGEEGRSGVAVDLLSIRWSSQFYGDVRVFCERHKRPLVRLPAGYNANQVASQILEQCSDRLQRTQLCKRITSGRRQSSGSSIHVPQRCRICLPQYLKVATRKSVFVCCPIECEISWSTRKMNRPGTRLSSLSRAGSPVEFCPSVFLPPTNCA